MREKKLLLVLFLLSAFCFLLADYSILDQGSNEVDLVSNGDTEITISYELNSIFAREYRAKEVIYSQLYLENFGLTGEIGKPQLPYSSKIIAVPEGAKVLTELKIEYTEDVDLQEKGVLNKIFPAQAAVSKSARAEELTFAFDEKAYSSFDFLVQDKVEVREIGYQRGMRLFEVNFYPVAYNPKANLFSLIRKASLNIKFQGADLFATQELRDKTFSPAFEALYPETIFNYKNNRSTLESYPLGYVIVSPSNYLDTLEPFVEWKTQQGYNVTILNTSTIGATTTSIKNAITNIWNSATSENPAPSYLLICGDTPQIPAYSGQTDSGHITDLDYVKLEGSDYLPEMYYGRFSATNISELATMVNKTLLYEKYEMADPSYLERATLIAGVDADFAPTHGNGTLNYGSQYYFNSAHDIDATTYYYPESGSSESSIFADVNAGLGFLNYTAHGSETTWYDPSFTVSNVNSLTNVEKYPVVVGNCCLTNHFDTATCFGEAWLRASNGAVIYIGGTNSTYWDEDYWWSVGHFTPTSTADPTYAGTGLGMYDALFHENGEEYVNWVNSAGAMVYRGNMTVQGSASSRKNYYWEIYSIMGDPSLIPMVGIPQAQNPNYSSNLMVGASSLNITAAPYSYVSLTVDGVIIGTQLLGSSGTGIVNFSPLTTPQDIKIVISRVDYQPYIADIQVIAGDGPYLTLSEYSVNDANNNGLLEYGESASLDMVIENIGSETSLSGTINFSETDPYISLNSTSVSVNSLTAGSEITIEDALDFTIADNIPNNHQINISYVITAGGDEYPGLITLTGISYEMSLINISINDISTGNANGVIDAGETFYVVATFENVGAVSSPSGIAAIAPETYITFSNTTSDIAIISEGGTLAVVFTGQASETIPAGAEITFTVSATYPNGQTEMSQDFLAALLQIGDGVITGAHLPIEPYYGYTYSETIYTSEEINLGPSQINKIAYHYNGNTAWSDNIVIYMGNTNKTSFSSTSDWLTSANLSEVYSGIFTAPSSDGWIEIELTTPFIYNGTSNLVIGFDENTSGYHASSDEFYCYASGANRSLYYYSDSTNPNPSSPVAGTLSSNNPNVRIFASSASAEAEISLSTTSLDFGEVILGNTVTRDFTITNTGGASLTGTIILPDNFTFASRRSVKDIYPSRISSQDFTISPAGSQSYSINFTPSVELCYNGNIEITNNAEEYSSYISLVACGIKPTYSSTTRLINKTLAPDDEDSYNFVINNSGSGDLELLIEITDEDRNSGGPDNYGYSWKDSNEDGIDYNWIDIASSGAIIAEGDDESEEISLPFNFSFYGTEYSSLYVCSNGFLSFVSSATAYENATIPNTTQPNGIIAPFWEDLKPAGTTWGNVYYQNFANYTIVQWENVSHYHSTTPLENETFQVILYSNGDIKYQYKTVANSSSSTLGIENQAGDDGLLIAYNNITLEDEYAILISADEVNTNWLAIDNDSLTIPELGSQTVLVSFNTSNMELGTYRKNLTLVTNDPEHQELIIPVTLIVGGTSEQNILVNTSEIDFGSVTANDFIMETITITNTGGEILTGNISADNGFTLTESRDNTSKNEFSVKHSGRKILRNQEFTLTSGTSKSYNVSHSTVQLGVFTGQITINSNDPDTPQLLLPLSLEVLDPANISVSPTFVSLNLVNEETAERTITIDNSGDIDLLCSLNLNFPEERELYQIFTANFDDHDLSDWSIDYLYSAAHTWHITDAYGSSSLDGSSFLFIDSDAAGSGNEMDDTIETPMFDISDYDEISIDFDHYFNKYTDEIADVDLWTGSEWINIARWYGADVGSWTNPSHFSYTLTNNGYSQVKLRFHYYDAVYEYYWAIDNLVISGEAEPLPQWVTLASQFETLTVNPDDSENILLNFSALDLPLGEYSATLNIQSNAGNNNNLNIPITLNIIELVNEPDWQAVIYPNNSATIYAEVTHLSDEISEEDVVSAWVDNECRGVGEIVIVNRSQAFTTIVVQSNGSSENVYFKLYDRSADQVIEESNSTPINSGQVVGSAQEPFPINIGSISLIAPNNIQVEVSNNITNINWNSVPYADYYIVYYSRDYHNWLEIGQTSNTSYQHNQVRSNTETHLYKIKAMKN